MELRPGSAPQPPLRGGAGPGGSMGSPPAFCGTSQAGKDRTASSRLHRTSTGTNTGGGKESACDHWTVEQVLTLCDILWHPHSGDTVLHACGLGSESRALAGSDVRGGWGRLFLCSPQQACTSCHSFLSCRLPLHGPLA